MTPSAPLSPGKFPRLSQRAGEERMTAPARPNPIPDSYRRVTPSLIVQGAAKALEFYAAVFGATERMRFPGPAGTIVHAEILIGDSVVIIADEDPPRGTNAPPAGGLVGSPASLFIYVQDVDAVIARAVELGASLQRPAEDQFYGDRDGYIIDPFGHGWTVASHVEDVTPEELARRMAELFGIDGGLVLLRDQDRSRWDREAST
jgi:PhnB protein